APNISKQLPFAGERCRFVFYEEGRTPISSGLLKQQAFAVVALRLSEPDREIHVTYGESLVKGLFVRGARLLMLARSSGPKSAEEFGTVFPDGVESTARTTSGHDHCDRADLGRIPLARHQ